MRPYTDSLDDLALNADLCKSGKDTCTCHRHIFANNQGYSCTHVHVGCTRVHIAITALPANDSRVSTSSNVWACDHHEMMCGLAI